MGNEDHSPGKLKIAQVVCTSEFAGAERYVQLLSCTLGRLGHDIEIIGGDNRIITEEMRDLGVTAQAGSTVAKAFFALMKGRKYDVIHAHMTAAESAATAAASLRGFPVVATRHFAAHRGKTGAGSLASRFIAPRLKAQIAISEFVAANVEGETILIPSGVENSPLGTHDQDVVLVAQRLESEKSTSVALRAWAASGLADRGWAMHVAGTGVEEEDLKDLARSLGISKSCIFLGFCDDIPDRMAKARIFLSTAAAEPFGLSVAEAMSTGLPVVAVSSGGTGETVGSASRRWLFDEGDYPTAGDHLAQLASYPETASLYGENLRKVQQEQFNIGDLARRTVDVYLDVLRN